MDSSGSTCTRLLPRALAALACLVVAALPVRAGDAGSSAAKPSAEAAGVAEKAPADSAAAVAEKAAAPDPVKAKMAERLERKLRTEYLKATREFAGRFRKGIPKGKRIVVYCTIGYRSGKYAMELAGQGIRAENLEGGILSWSHAGGPFQVRNDAGLATPTRRVHVYDKGWNLLHPDYEAVW